MSFQKDVTTTFLSQVSVLFLGMVQSVIVARYLLPEGRGQYATLMLIPELAVLIAPLGLQWAMIYQLRREQHRPEILLQNGLGVALLLGGAGFLFALGAEIALRDSLLTGFSVGVLALAALAVPARVLHRCWLGVFRGSERIQHANATNVVRRALLFVGAITALVLLAGGVAELVVAVILVEVCVALLVGLVAFRGVQIRVRLDRPVVASFLSYGVRIYAFSILMFINYRVDLGIIRYFVEYREVGFYVTAVTLAEVLLTIPASLNFVLFPKAIGVSDEMRTGMTSRVTRVTSFLMLLICVLVALFAYPLISVLYTSAFLPAAGMLIAILPGILAMSVQQVLAADLSARGRPEMVTLAAAFGIVLNVGLNLWWVPKIGALGAALASSVSYSAIALVVLLCFLRLAGVGVRETLVIRREDLREIVARLRRLRGEGSVA